MNTKTSLPTKEEACRRAGEKLATERLLEVDRSPREQAELSWHPGCRFSVDQLEDMVRAERGLPAVHGGATA